MGSNRQRDFSSDPWALAQTQGGERSSHRRRSPVLASTRLRWAPRVVGSPLHPPSDAAATASFLLGPGSPGGLWEPLLMRRPDSRLQNKTWSELVKSQMSQQMDRHCPEMPPTLRQGDSWRLTP